MRIYPYRTTFDKLEHAHQEIADAGDSLMSTHFLGGRDWVLICHTPADPAIQHMTAAELQQVIADGVAAGLKRHADLSHVRKVG